MKKTLLVVATAGSMLMGSMLAQADEAKDIDNIERYVLELDTSDMTPEEIAATRGELVAKFKRSFFGTKIFAGFELVKGTRRNSQGHLETYWRNH